MLCIILIKTFLAVLMHTQVSQSQNIEYMRIKKVVQIVRTLKINSKVIINDFEIKFDWFMFKQCLKVSCYLCIFIFSSSCNCKL